MRLHVPEENDLQVELREEALGEGRKDPHIPPERRW